MKTIVKFGLVAAAMTSISAAARAQAVASVGMTATVNASVTASVENALAFGTVLQGGAATTIASNSASAGKVDIVGTDGAGITITATLFPTTLTSGANTLGVSNYTYCYDAADSQSPCPFSGPVTNWPFTPTLNGATGTGYLWIGATLAAPAANQAPGDYTGTITITITSP